MEMLQKQYSCTSKFRCTLLPPGFLLELFVCVSLILFVCICSVSQFIYHFVLMFANPCESYKLYQPRNCLRICYCSIYSVTPIDCSRLRHRCDLKIEKARTREWEGTGERKDDATASTHLPFPSPELIFSCVFYLRVIPTI